MDKLHMPFPASLRARLWGTVIVCVCAAGTASVPAYSQSALKGHDTYQELDISAERLEVKQKAGQALFKGAVKVIQGTLKLDADQLTVFYATEEGSENPSIERLDASGHVFLISDSEQVQANWGIYDVERRTVTMGGAVTLTRGTNILNGERLELDLTSGFAKLDGKAAAGGRVEGRFSAPKSPK